MGARVLLAGGLLSASGCTADVEDGDMEHLASDSSAIVLDRANYRLLTQLDGLGPEGARALYGRAVGTFPLTGCSGFLIEDNVVVSARQCRMAGEAEVESPTLDVDFGSYGSGANTGNFTTAIVEAMGRLLSLGVPVSVFTNGQITLETLTRWSCTVSQQTPGRDVEYFTCDPNPIVWTNPNGTATQLALMPGHLWGHFNVAPQVPAAISSLRNYGVNRRCGDSAKSTLVSTGIMWETSEACDEWVSDTFGACFEYTSDANAMHEGGPILLDGSNQVFGIHTGHWHFWAEDSGDDSDPCASADSHFAENLGTFIGSDVANFTGSAPNGNGMPAGTTLTSGAYFGGNGGSAKWLTCPLNYLAAGVIGSTSNDGYLGNFGLVCMPNRDFFQGDLTADVTPYRLDRALVLAGGSQDTGPAADRVDLNSYFNEVQTSTGASPFRQRLEMCPPGEYLKSITGHFGNYAGRVTHIVCAPPKITNTETTREILAALGTVTSAQAPSYSQQTTACSQTFGFLAGLYIRSGAHTDGYQALCRRSF
jgi:hypothetical protein